MTSRWLSSGVAAMVVIAAGCGGSEGTDGDVPPTAVAGAAASDCSLPDGDTSIASLLRFVADDEANRAQVSISDLQEFLHTQSKELPEDFDAIVWAGSAGSSFVPTRQLRLAIGTLQNDSDGLADEYGIGIGQVERSVAFGAQPEGTELFVGSFDPAAMQQAVEDDPVWSDELVEVESSGETFYSWGDGHERRTDRITPLRDFGVGGRMWPGADVAAFTVTTPPMERLLATCTGAAASLADDDDYRGIAERLDEFDGLFHATLTDVFGADSDPSRQVTALEDVTAYGFASGPSDDADVARIRLVIASESAEAAAANEQRFADHIANDASASSRQPWAELLRIEHSEVDDRFVIVDLAADHITEFDASFYRGDDLVVVSR